ncbi:protein phosphatase 2C domain-containing protein [Eubacterium sp. MSJ-13]|uniref:PP2C family protein-serine/threonine phosphatase n=1 Tax=Eubacterium sp. MSJ-13 TaxID=2841513 RepID=UPI001C1187D5|nr:protein phosphatase 2C domain-containing protein [Eubacterium sp. MSJ-13]MBU5477685.1 protein phosphatase 2C domain-containing protein [Eubacterium sp. MSJ-13]
MLRYVGIVDRGLVHETNDDAAMLKHSVIHDGFFEGESLIEGGLFAVADGVGSIENSELASRYVLYCLEECNSRKSEEIIQCINEANSGLVKNHYGNILSTTLCVVGILGSQLVSYNVGNSRLYRFRGGFLRQLTRDHSKVQELLDTGILNEETAKDYPGKNIITRCLGAADFSTDWITVTEHRENFKYNDILMLCTDGIHDYIRIEELESILSDDMSLREKAKMIIQCAHDKGGQDNETVVLIEKNE